MKNNLENQTPKNNKMIIIIIVILAILLIGGGGYFVYDKFIANSNAEEKNNDNNDNKENENKQEQIEYNDFSFENFNINLINRLDNINDIYAFDIKNNKDSDKANDIVARYKDEKTVRLASISQKLDYRILDISDNKVYFLIFDNNSASNTNLFELYYIDLNNLDKGATVLSDFNEMYKKESEYCISSTGNCTTYSTQIYVKNNLIYYSSFKNGTIKTYDITSKETKTIINEKVSWYNYLVDKANNKIFYESDTDRSLYLINLDGSNKIELDNEINKSSDFWRNGYLNNSPIFAGGKDDDENIGCGSEKCIYNLYKFDYSNNTFVEIKNK